MSKYAASAQYYKLASHAPVDSTSHSNMARLPPSSHMDYVLASSAVPSTLDMSCCAGIAHCDVKLDNVLVTGLDATVKLADFGWSCLAEEGNCHGAGAGCSRPLSGTAEYVAPEVCTLQHHRASVTVVSVSAAAGAHSPAQRRHSSRTQGSGICHA